MTYRILTAPTPDGLAAHVLDAIADGWAPLGGVAAAPDARKGQGPISYAQAVTATAQSLATAARRKRPPSEPHA